MKYKKKELVKFFFSYQRKYLHLAVWTAILLLFNVLLQLPMPLVTRYLIDSIIPAKDFKSLNILCIALLVIILIRIFSNYFLQYLITRYKTRVRFDMEQALYLHIQELPLSFFNERPSGYILSRIAEISSVDSILADTFLYILQDIITIIVGAVLILKMHVPLGLISLFLLPFFVLSIKAFHKKIKGINKELREESAQYTGKLEKNLTAIEKIKSAVIEEKQGKQVTNKLSRVIALVFKSEMISALAGSVSAFIGMIAPFVVLWYGVSEIIRGRLTLGTFVAINAFLSYLYSPARRLTDTGYSISRAMAGLERIYEIFNYKREATGGDTLQSIDSIEFRDVEFTYNGNDWVLRHLNLKIGKGEKIALVGESGQGKSTIVRMILKFFEPTRGSIFISGKDSKTIEIKSLRRKIAYIPQRQYIIEDELEEKIKDLQAVNLLKKFKFEKVLQEVDNGIKQKEFSGGEIQKIEMMESILKAADVLIIDEGTSNIDFNAEKIILEEILSKYQDKIIIFIAHRLTSITGFKRIIVLDNGCIAEEGEHDALTVKKGKYFYLWGKQELKPSSA